MRAQWAGRGLAAIIVATSSVLSIPAVAGAQVPPGPVVDPELHPCPLAPPAPVADLGDLPTGVLVPDLLHVVLDQSTGEIVLQQLFVEQGAQLWTTVAFEGPPGSDTRVDLGLVPGSYTLTLTVTDCRGQTDSVSQRVWFWNAQPFPP